MHFIVTIQHIHTVNVINLTVNSIGFSGTKIVLSTKTKSVNYFGPRKDFLKKISDKLLLLQIEIDCKPKRREEPFHQTEVKETFYDI